MIAETQVCDVRELLMQINLQNSLEFYNKNKELVPEVNSGRFYDNTIGSAEKLILDAGKGWKFDGEGNVILFNSLA